MNKKQMLKNLKDNLAKDTKYYKFNRIPLRDNETSVYFDGSNPLYQFGIGTTVLYGVNQYPFLISDIAYEENGKLYQILTNKEIKVIEEGINDINEDIITAAATIREASDDYIEFYVSCVTIKSNWKEFIQKEKVKRRK